MKGWGELRMANLGFNAIIKGMRTVCLINPNDVAIAVWPEKQIPGKEWAVRLEPHTSVELTTEEEIFEVDDFRWAEWSSSFENLVRPIPEIEGFYWK